ncbi:OPT oligopeptide transporter protein-domain-containing protein [Truncatella angustata]|uniref:OPT oligopeptide transporter protein-domain-containing protein n=1 Tax=Truncatella angustata TaxID=152316 RepID=A0A9P8UJ26_9PEZI|nr:OPT oligopeptide transporter protein-domain-containing protein [Truncatella angustata]KAH6653062.1 OPT oligopeptide transporter protein-domain-containing protein [Truncatella angustata]
MNLLMGQHITGLIIPSAVVQLIAYPMGKGWAAAMPHIHIFGIPLNPGPFNKKEHTIITMMTAAGASTSYAFDILLAQQQFYGQKWGWGFQILLTISTQALGFGMAGMLRRFLVWPAAMIWPSTLITTTVMDSLHDHRPTDPSQANGWSIGRYRFFIIVAAACFGWHWVPFVIAPFLSYLGNFPTWAAPNNLAVNQVFGGLHGLGIMPITLDWTVVTGFFLSPLMYPSFALINMGVGGLLFLLGIVGLGFAAQDYMKYLPLLANTNFDHFGEKYNTTRILTADLTLDVAAYEAYSPLFVGPAFALAYGLGFATLISTLVHVGLFYGKDIWHRTKNARYEEPDVHLKLIRNYREAPEWWFLTVFVISFVFGLVAAVCWDTHLPWWAYIVTIIIGAFFVLPVGIIQAVTNSQTGLNVITEMIVGYMLPGRPVAMMLFKSFGYMFAYNCLQYVSDLKVGHYMKVPPRSMFRAQLFAVIWLSLVQVATFNWMLGALPAVCTEDQPQGFTCAGARTFFNASVIWGLIGPKRMFGAGALYSWCNWFWLVGAALPAIQYVIARKYPKSPAKYIFFPALFGISGMIPPATLFALLCWLTVGLTFNVVVKRKYFGWWKRYTYVFSGAMDIGAACCLVLYAVSIGISEASFPSWWGNTGWADNLDQNGLTMSKTLPDDGSFFGPTTWR